MAEVSSKPRPEWIWYVRIPWVTTKIYQRIRDGISDFLVIPIGGNWGKKNSRSNVNGDWRFKRRTRELVEVERSRDVKEHPGVSKLAYNKLPSPDAIRLLHLQPGVYPDPIQCRMSTHRIGDIPSYEAFGLISDIGRAALDSRKSDKTHSPKAFTAEDLVSARLPDVSSTAWKALDSLFWRPWFTRVWVIQEVTVARDAAVICGPDQCQWSEVTIAAKFITDHHLTATTLVDPRRTIKFMHLGSGFQSGMPLLLLELLSEARDADATDDRDKIFALLGIAKDADYEHMLLRPDYNKHVVNIFANLARYFVERDKNLDVLGAAANHRFGLKRYPMIDEKTGVKQLPLNNGETPSWAPDWEVHLTLSPFILHPSFPTMNAGGTTTASCTFSEDGTTLLTRGFAFDSVARVGDTFVESVPASGSGFPSPNASRNSLRTKELLGFVDFVTEQRWRQWQKMATDLRTYPTGEDVMKAFILTLVAGIDPFTTLSDDVLFAQYATWSKFWKRAGLIEVAHVRSIYSETDSSELVLAIEFLEAQMKSAYGRRFFTTEKGYMGLCNSGARIGQKVVILEGGRTPFVLQKRWKDRYTFIGECYVHGIMHGEAIDKAVDPSMSKGTFKTEIFKIN